jgi:hypothetical protein
MEEKKDSDTPPSEQISNTPKQHSSGTSFPERDHAHNDPISQCQKTSDSEREPSPMELKRISEWFNGLNHDGVTALFTVGIFIATAIYAVVATLQWCAMRRSNEINNGALVSVQRAFVSPRRREITPIIDSKLNQATAVQIDVGWENNGTTPAKSLTQHVSTRWDKNPIPDNFDFPDQWFPNVDHTVRPTYLGPKGSLGGGIFMVPAQALKAIQEGNYHVYYWGWARYNDVFLQQHLTELCFELKSNGSPLGSTATFPFRLDECAKHNCIDDDCKEQ